MSSGNTRAGFPGVAESPLSGPDPGGIGPGGPGRYGCAAATMRSRCDVRVRDGPVEPIRSARTQRKDTQVTVEWTDLDRQAVDTVRALAMDAVQKVGNGHPGTAMSLAPAAYLLFQRFLRHDPADPSWIGRDRFVLSNGHSSLTHYIQLYFSGYGLELSDLEAFRTWGSKTPGHPEYGHTIGIETTTGPL